MVYILHVYDFNAYNKLFLYFIIQHLFFHIPK